MDRKTRIRGRDVAMTLAAVVVVIAGIRAASPIVVPFLLSLFIAVISSPFMVWLKARGLPGGRCSTC